MQHDATIYCDFCGKSQHQVSKVIAHASQGMIHAICNECVSLCNDILRHETAHRHMLPGDIGVSA